MAEDEQSGADSAELNVPADGESLEGSRPEIANSDENSNPDNHEQADKTADSPNDSLPQPPPVKNLGLINRLRRRFNTYLLLFILVIVTALVIVLIAYVQGRQANTNHFQTQSLSQKTLDQLANGDVTVGSNQSVLNVQSSAVFAGQVLLRQNLQVAGNLQIGGTVALNNIAVSGTSQFGQVAINKDLAIAGNSAVQGTQTIAKSLQVNGNATFSGPVSAPQITASSLQINGDLVLTHHISAGGATPGRSNGPALGSGGSASISGSDTAGSVSINTGSGPAACCLVTINFTTHFNATPHVLVTPIGSSAGGLSYYVNRSTTSFSICVASPAPAGSSFGFDYFILD